MFGPEISKQVLLKGTVGLVLAWGGIQLKSALSSHPQNIAAVIMEYPQLVRAYPGLCDALSELHRVLGDAGDMREIMQQITYLRDLDLSSDDASQWKISRVCGGIELKCSSMVKRVDALSSDEAFRSSLRLQEDVMPTIKNHLDSILHNHLLSH